MTRTKSTLTHLECGNCGKTYDANQLINLCAECGKPLLARYDLGTAALTLTKEALQAAARPAFGATKKCCPCRMTGPASPGRRLDAAAPCQAAGRVHRLPQHLHQG